jgi:2-phosphosulfolactate phosphatase
VFWGRGGAQRAARIGGILVIVDVLSFSTAVSTAVAGGGIIIPCANDSEAARIAESVGAVAATHRREVRAGKGFSLSPLTFVDIEPGTTVALGSPNGAVCSLYGGAAEHLVVGALVNAAAVARVVSGLLSRSGASVSIIACGERWMEPIEGEGMRVAVEDYLGAGAIISGLDVEKSPEALVCQGAFLQLRDQLSRIISDCGSGRELRAKGFAGDVEHSARLDRYDAVPIMRDDRLLAFDPSEVL